MDALSLIDEFVSDEGVVLRSDSNETPLSSNNDFRNVLMLLSIDRLLSPSGELNVQVSRVASALSQSDRTFGSRRIEILEED
jgi:hypothetical protein